MKILLANPRGFCAGVERAIAIVERAIAKFGTPVYVRHEVVHNRFVCDELRQKGAIFVDDLADVPEGAMLIFSAHGVSKAVQEEAEARNFRIFDATCPLVTRVHRQVARLKSAGYEIVMIGHKGHPEVEGTMGQCNGCIQLIEKAEDVKTLTIHTPQKLAYVTQTTLSVDEVKTTVAALKARFPEVLEPQNDDICYATQNRQDAVKDLSKSADVMLVVGSPASSNSNRLREVAAERGVSSYLIDSKEDICDEWFLNAKTIGLTAGASAPEVLVQDVLAYLQEHHHGKVLECEGLAENVTFALPKALL